MNLSNSTALTISNVKLVDLIPSLSIRFTLHALDVCCSLATLVTLSRWRQMRSFSMSLICLMMANEFLSAVVLGSLEGWHIFDYFAEISEVDLTGDQCYWRTGYEGPVIQLELVSALMVSLDRVCSIVVPTIHEKLPFLLKVAAFSTPFVLSTIVLTLLASSNVKRTALEICTTAYISYTSPVGAVGLTVAHTVMNVCTYGTVVTYAAVLILIYVKYKVNAIGDGSHSNTGSMEEIRVRRYRKLNKVLAFSTMGYFLTSSTANTIYLYVGTQKGAMSAVTSFLRGLYAVDGIVTFAAFLLFIPSFKKQLLGKSDND